MGDTSYRYELRRGGEIIATGHLSHEEPLEPGDQIAIGRARGVVRDIEPTLGQTERRLVIELLPATLDT
jgi:hypothetical protein